MLNRDAERFRGLSGEETLAYQVIEQAANAGKFEVQEMSTLAA